MTVRRPLAALAALLLLSGVAGAQQSGSPFSVGVGAGLAAPSGDLSDGFKPAFALQGYVNYKLGTSGLAVRADIGWHYFDSQSNQRTSLTTGTLVSGNVTTLTSGGALVYQFSGLSAFRPYVLGGATAVTADMSLRSRLTGGGTRVAARNETAVGALVGAGFDFVFAGTRMYAEARYVSANALGGTVGTIPVTLGFRF